jgi:hypothetical protein
MAANRININARDRIGFIFSHSETTLFFPALPPREQRTPYGESDIRRGVLRQAGPPADKQMVFQSGKKQQYPERRPYHRPRSGDRPCCGTT